MERYFSGNDLRQLFSLNPSPCEVSRVKPLCVETARADHPRCATRAPADARLVQVQALQRRSPGPQGSGDALRRCLDVSLSTAWSDESSHRDSMFVVDFGNACLVLFRWNHLRNEDLAKNHDLLLRAEHGIEGVTACFQCKSPWSLSRRYGNRLADFSGAVPQISRRKTHKKREQTRCTAALLFCLPFDHSAICIHLSLACCRICILHVYPPSKPQIRVRSERELSFSSRFFPTPVIASFRAWESMESEFEVLRV